MLEVRGTVSRMHVFVLLRIKVIIIKYKMEGKNILSGASYCELGLY